MDRENSTCWTLVRRAAEGDPDSRAAYCRLYGPVIKAYLAARWHLSFDHEEVQDGTQEVFMQCLKPNGALSRVESDRPGGFRAFLYGVTRNVAGTIEASRARRRNETQDENLDARNDADDPTMSRIFDRAFAVVLTKEARRLMAERAEPGSGAETRLKLLELMYEDGLPSRDIADRLGLDTDAVYRSLTRARREFKAALLEVIAGYHPNDSREELERRCIEVFSAL